jgi:hypothetical protein
MYDYEESIRHKMLSSFSHTFVWNVLHSDTQQITKICIEVLLGFCVKMGTCVWHVMPCSSRCLPTLQRNALPPSSGSKSQISRESCCPILIRTVMGVPIFVNSPISNFM